MARTKRSVKPLPTIWEASDEQWALIQPILAQHDPPAATGRKRIDPRRAFNGVIYHLRTGCQWKALDQTELCAGSTAHDRFQEWVEAGVFLRLWQVGVEQFDELKGIEWEWLSMDGAMTKAPLGGGKNRI